MAFVFFRGQILAEAGGFDDWQAQQHPSLITADIDLSKTKKVRSAMALKPRTDLLDITVCP